VSGRVKEVVLCWGVGVVGGALAVSQSVGMVWRRAHQKINHWCSLWTSFVGRRWRRWFHAHRSPTMTARPHRPRKRRVRLGEESDHAESREEIAAAAAAAGAPVETHDEQMMSPTSQHTPNAAPSIAVLAQVGANDAHRRQQQRARREAQPNWTVEEDRELLELANQFGRNWKVVVKRSLLFAQKKRTQNACRTRYQSLKSAYAARQRRDAELASAASLLPRGGAPPPSRLTRGASAIGGPRRVTRQRERRLSALTTSAQVSRQEIDARRN